jgi:hypothetical protein
MHWLVVCQSLRSFFIRGDLSVHVGSTRVGFDVVYESFGYESRN